jgi:hypothetical protein
VEIGELDRAIGQLIDIRSSDFATIGTNICIPKVVRDDKKNVRAFFLCENGPGSANQKQQAGSDRIHAQRPPKA